MKHAADVGPDAVPDVLEGAVVPLRMAGISPEGLRRRLGSRREQTQRQEERERQGPGAESHGRISEESRRDSVDFEGLQKTPPDEERGASAKVFSDDDDAD